MDKLNNNCETFIIMSIIVFDNYEGAKIKESNIKKKKKDLLYLTIKDL
jgi:hypothetical protein